MLNLALLRHPANWMIVGAVLLFWASLAYLIETGLADQDEKRSVSDA